MEEGKMINFYSVDVDDDSLKSLRRFAPKVETGYHIVSTFLLVSVQNLYFL